MVRFRKQYCVRDLSTNITSTVIFQVCQRICFESEAHLDNALSPVTTALM